MIPKLVGVCGAIGAGKDTVAAALVAQLGFQRIAFADALKETCFDVFGPLGAERQDFFGTQEEKAAPIACLGNVTGRRILEVVGSEGFRAVVPSVWVDLALVRARGRSRVVIPDVRFPNEVEAIRAEGGVVWRVVRVGGPETKTGHASDVALDAYAADAILVARSGDVNGLQYQSVALAQAGGRTPLPSLDR